MKKNESVQSLTILFKIKIASFFVVCMLILHLCYILQREATEHELILNIEFKYAVVSYSFIILLLGILII